ncbi:MAG: DUF1902 domain-containing protein [Cyanothece sp. SIO1E1]|nr:DUF1902 domain-containing protein [Cyanothece sp. SIO1E1]
MEHNTLQITAFWDADSAVWVATSDDIPGLATEADSFDALQQKLRVMVPELLMLNQVISEDYRGTISFELTSHTQETIEVA